MPKVRVTLQKPSRFNVVGRLRGDVTVTVERYMSGSQSYKRVPAKDVEVAYAA